MLTGIEAINSINQRNIEAVTSAVTALENSLINLEESIRGRQNTTVTDNRKTRISPPTPEESLVIVPPHERNQFLDFARNMPQVQEGSFSINNTFITVDPSQESFRDVMHKINSSTENVIASYDPQLNRFTIQAHDQDAMISLGNDTSNFLMEVNLKLGSYLGSTDAPTFGSNSPTSSVGQVYNRIVDVSNDLNTMFMSEAITNTIKSQFQGDLISTIFANEPVNPSASRFYVSWGMDANFLPNVPQPIMTYRDTTFNQLEKDSHTVVRFWSGDETDNGFIRRAYETINSLKGEYDRLVNEIV